MSSGDKPPSGSSSAPTPNERAPSSGASENTGSYGTVSASPTPQASSQRGAYVPTFAAGELVAERYRIVRYIAKGGMGEVYEADDLELKDRVALKTVRGEMAEQDAVVQRFKREINLARKVSHPNVCRIFDLGRHRVAPTPEAPSGEVLFLTMELLLGETLSQRLKRGGKLPPAEALSIIRQMAAALATAHDAGIVHRDFKSSNVMLVSGKSGERAVVTDFGLARGGAEGAALTGTGDILGTPAYMAPEQVESGKVGPAADLYALGIVVYEMVTGILPFAGDSPLSVALKRLTVTPDAPKLHAPGLDARWDAAILRCLERRPEDRFESALDVVRALEGEKVAPRRRRRAWAKVAGATGMLAALAAVYFLARSRPDLPPTAPPPSAEATGPHPAAAVKLRRAVAVLGFKNLGKPEAAWLSTAVAEMLRTELSAGEKVRVIPSESVARMKLELALADADSFARDTLAKIRANVAADYVVVGSYLALGNGQLRLDLRLQDTQRGETLAASAAEGSEDGVFKLVSDAGARLREALGLGRVSTMDVATVRASFPASQEAAQFYSAGLAKLRVFDALDARALLEKATLAEPRHPLLHASLATAWSLLGYDKKAQAESKLAFDLSTDLTREDRLAVQGLHNELTGDWDKAIETYRALLVFFPDRLDFGLRLAAAQTSGGKGKDALATLAELRRLPAPASADPRIDLAEAEASKALTDFARQQRVAAAAAAKALAQGARLLHAQALFAEGSALVNLGRLVEARKRCQESGEIFAAAGDGASVARSENVVAVAYAMAGDFQSARDGFEQALKAFQKIGNQRGIALQLGNLANADLRLGQAARAKALYEQALLVSREIGDLAGAARTLTNLATLHEEQGRLDPALKSHEQALAAWRQLGAKGNVSVVLANIGEVFRKKGQLDEAQGRFEDALKVAREAGIHTDDVAWAHAQLADVLLRRSNAERAERELDEALAIYRGTGSRGEEAGVLRRLAELREKRGDAAGARGFRDQADKIDKEQGAGK